MTTKQTTINKTNLILPSPMLECPMCTIIISRWRSMEKDDCYLKYANRLMVSYLCSINWFEILLFMISLIIVKVIIFVIWKEFFSCIMPLISNDIPLCILYSMSYSSKIRDMCICRQNITRLEWGWKGHNSWIIKIIEPLIDTCWTICFWQVIHTTSILFYPLTYLLLLFICLFLKPIHTVKNMSTSRLSNSRTTTWRFMWNSRKAILTSIWAFYRFIIITQSLSL